MSSPTPPVALKDHCTVIYDNTLYAYSSSAFQSLDLEENAEWAQLQNGVSVTGATCTLGYMDGNPSKTALFVVGGISTADDGNDIYTGLQAYLFDEKSWSTIWPASEVTQGRRFHGSAFLNDSSSLLVYAGSKEDEGDSTTLSSATFLISTKSPYTVLSYSSDAPPAVNPILLQWNSSHAVEMGGKSSNRELWTFGPDQGWQKLGVSLVNTLKATTKVQAALIEGNDGSKILETFDLSTSPSTVNGTALLVANGKVANSGDQIFSSASSKSSKQRRRKKSRSLGVDNFPSFNSTNQPTTTRTNFSLAQSSNGLIAISGGNSDDPILLFNQTANSWIDTAEFFGNEKSTKTSSSSASSSASTTTAVATASATSSSTSSSSSRSHTLKVLGATLGSICGVAAFLVFLLILFKWMQAKKIEQQKKDGTFPDDNKNRLSFADRGVSFMKEAEGAPSHHSPSMVSDDSAAILTGKKPNSNKENFWKSKGIGSEPFRPQEGFGMKTVEAEASTSAAGPVLLNPQPQRASTGWSKYFSGVTAGESIRDDPSHYSGSEYLDYQPSPHHESAEVPPLNFDGQRIDRVHTGSPALKHLDTNVNGSGLVATNGQVAEVWPRPGSANSNESREINALAAGADLKDDQCWTPIDNRSTWNARASSNYDGASSYYGPSQPPSMVINSFPAPGGNGLLIAPNANLGRESSTTQWPLSEDMSAQVKEGGQGENDNKKDSIAPNTDMSWLNLGSTREG